MSSPASRLLTIIELLQAQKSLTGREIAERLSVDVRSVRRYILMLEDLGIPITAVRGKIGGYRLMSGYKLPPLMFNENEVLAVLLGLSAAKRIGFSKSQDADIVGAQAKISRVLPDALRTRMAALESSLVWDWSLPRSQNGEVDAETVMKLAESVTRQEQTQLNYRSLDGATTKRLVAPYGLVCRNGLWYLIGYCYLRSAIRLFRIDRILAVMTVGESFDRPKDFDILTEVTFALGSVKRALRLEVLLETSLVFAQHHISAGVAVLEETGDGRVRLRGYTDYPKFVARTLAGLGCPMEIVDPPELRVAVSELARELLNSCANK